MHAAIISAASVLAGVLLQTLITLTTDRRTHAAHQRDRLNNALDAVLETAGRFRNRQHLKHKARAKNLDDTLETIRDRFDAQSALNGAIDRLHTATGDQQLLAAAQEVFATACALGDADTDDALEAASLAAKQAHTALRQAANRALFP
ncbi:hypothetical protein [Streptomyces sp. NPDC001658]